MVDDEYSPGVDGLDAVLGREGIAWGCRGMQGEERLLRRSEATNHPPTWRERFRLKLAILSDQPSNPAPSHRDDGATTNDPVQDDSGPCQGTKPQRRLSSPERPVHP